MDEQWLEEFADALTTMELSDVGYISKAIAHSRDDVAIELSLYLTHERFHEIKMILPRSEFIIGVDRPTYGIKPRIFVRGPWLTRVHLRRYSAFALVDAIGVKSAMRAGALTGPRLLSLRERIDDLAAAYPRVAFVSFADSLLVKSDWTIGQYDSEIRYTYAPETLIRLFTQIQDVYRAELSMEIYAIMTQGSNEYDEDLPLHISKAGNHVSLNSLGLPFAQLLAIDAAATRAIKRDAHAPYDLYLDKSFHSSLRFDYGKYDKNAEPRYAYDAPLASEGSYICAMSAVLLGNLASEVRS